jgi:two-component system CheB/CheR fusion protein
MEGHESVLPELLARASKMPVYTIETDLEVEPDKIYVIPPGKNIAIKKGRFVLEKPGSPRKMPIDYFFTNLASQYNEKAIGIVLSGTANDGTLGLKEIQAEGGLTFVQDELSAEFKSMPHSAVKDLNVNYVLPPGKIAEQLVQLSRTGALKDIPHPETENIEKGKIETTTDNDALKNIFKILSQRTGVDFLYYKPSTISRRINRRMAHNKVKTLKEYHKFLKNNPSEADILYNDLLINVTNFFRDPETFETLIKVAYPVIENNNSQNSPIRVWVPGCSSGEEVYSLAITLYEYFGQDTRRSFQLFATDISDTVLEKARKGIYSSAILEDVSPKRLKNFFKPLDDGSFQINRNIRDLVIFAHHDLVTDPPFSKIDLISCQNVLIYLSPVLQKKIIPLFHFALKMHGFLMLGNNESVGTFADLFTLADKKHKIYQKKPSSQRTLVNLQSDQYSQEKRMKKNINNQELPYLHEIDKLILSKYTLSGVLVNEAMEIILFRGDTSPFIEPLPGTATLNLFKMIRQELLIDIRTMINKVQGDKKAVKKEGIQLKSYGLKRKVSIEIVPFSNSQQKKDNYYFILFEGGEPAEKFSVDGDIPLPADGKEQNLYNELQTTKEYLQSIIEQRESSNEELRSTLEELQSSNEELQSINEEMETAKEELQATNEELTTVNDELHNRNIELIYLNNDLVNILSSVNIPILLLDGDMKIRRYTPVTEKIFNLIPSDIGRPISNLKSNINLVNLEALISEVQSTLNTKEIETQDLAGKWYSLRIQPYKTVDKKIDGVIVTLIDIDVLKKSYEAVEKSRKFANEIIDTVREPLLILNDKMVVQKASKSFYKFFHLVPAEAEGVCIYDVSDGLFSFDSLKSALNSVLKDGKMFESHVIEAIIRSNPKKLALNARQVIQDHDASPAILVAIEELKT